MNPAAVGDYKFDIDLKKGHHWENELYKILTSVNDIKIEVKADRMAGVTGNLAIEFKCRGKHSGLSTTESTHYAFVLGGGNYNDEVIILIQTDRLKSIVKKVYKRDKKIIKGGDENRSDMILIQVYDLLTTNLKRK